MTILNTKRRKLLALAAIGAAATALPSRWSQPIIRSVVLPAHAQTSMCTADTTVGGPLLGNSSGADNCQTACEDEAQSQGAQLCSVEESVDASGATQCNCDLDAS